MSPRVGGAPQQELDAVERCRDAKVKAAEVLGVGLPCEIEGVAQELAETAAMKRPEKGRFLKAVPSWACDGFRMQASQYDNSEKPDPAASPAGLPEVCDIEEYDDGFGYGGCSTDDP